MCRCGVIPVCTDGANGGNASGVFGRQPADRSARAGCLEPDDGRGKGTPELCAGKIQFARMSAPGHS